MKKYHQTIFLRCAVIAVVFFGVVIFANAQDAGLDSELRRQTANQPSRRASLLQQLDLSPEQIQKIRLINQEARQDVRRAALRQRQARRALDQAIYSEPIDETAISQRTREYVEAQSQATTLRARLEFRLRQVLNADQLAAFLELRRQAMQNFAPRNLRRFAAPDERKRRYPPKRQF